MKTYHFSKLATIPLSLLFATNTAAKTINLRGIAKDISTSDETSPASSSWAVPSQQTSDKPQCALDVASLNPGDVQIELPGKVGFESFPNCTSTFPPEYLDEMGVDPNTCIMSVPQLIKASEYVISNFAKYMPQESLDMLKYWKGTLSTERAGMITCDVSTGQPSTSYSLKAWRPYHMTEGWHYFTMEECNENGWSGFGQDETVDINMKFNGKIGYASQNSRAGEQFISIVSASYNIGNVGEEATKACCAPAPGVSRDCSAVHAMIDNFDLSSIDK